MTLIDANHSLLANEYHADLLIVGAGVAGLVIADRMRGSGITIDIIETGGLGYEQASQDLNVAEMDGEHHSGTTNGRFRIFGGNSTRWGAQLLTMASSDFIAKSYLDHSGWPLSHLELSPYLHDCERLLAVNHLSYESDFQNQLNSPLLSLSDQSFQYRFSKRAAYRYRNMARTLGQRCRQDPNIRIFLHATVTNIILDPSNSKVNFLEVRHTKSSTKLRLCGRQVVLAAGAIETCRLLLASNNVYRRGIGNHSDHLGCWFHDHLVVNAAVLHPIQRNKFLRKIAPWHIGQTCHYLKFATTSHWQNLNGCLNVSGHLSFEYQKNSIMEWLSFQIHAFRIGTVGARIRDFPFRRLPSELFDVFLQAWMRMYFKRLWCPANADIVLRIEVEQKPTMENRISLSNDLDKLGMPKAVINWRMAEDERRTFACYKKLFASQWQRWNIGDITWLADFEPNTGWEMSVNDNYHIMGGSRMSNSPNDGVVDTNLNVFGISNLSIASLSVFPTGGVSNPTLTLMMLALRLADRLKVTLH